MASVHKPQSGQVGFIVSAAPHRVFFLAGAIQLVAALLFWLYILSGIYAHALSTPALTALGSAAHAFLMLYGLFTFFVFGFLTTVFPRWLGTEAVARQRYSAIAAVMSIGMLCYYGGVFTTRALALLGVALFLAGWGWQLFTLLQIWRRSRRAGKYLVLYPFGCVTGGWIGAGIYAAWLITPRAGLLNIAITMGLWLYLIPLIVAVSHRMIPFFSSSVLSDYTVIKPGWTLPATLVCVLGHFVLTVSGHAHWSVLVDLPLALLAAWHSLRWGLIRSLRVPLLSMLHMSFAWLAVAMALYSAQSLLRLTGASFDLGLAPLHALGIGFVTGMVVAMASRVSLGHSGRALVADWVTLWTFALVQVVAIVRVLAEIPPLNSTMMGPWLILAAAAIWLSAFVPWSLRFGVVYVSPRIDGRPG